MPATTHATTVTAAAAPALADYDWILVNSSAGKDSQCALEVVAKAAKRLGISDRVVVVHADLGENVEWEGTKALAAEQAAFYGLRFEVRTNAKRDILGQVTQRFADRPDAPSWPSSAARWCTSDHKRGPIRTLMTALVTESREAGLTERPVRILNVMGLRADESSARAKKASYEVDNNASNGKRQVDTWLPILAWTEQTVWARIKASGVPYHKAYDMGMGRLSCMFCVLATKEDLVISAKCNPEAALRYAAVEEAVGWSFTQKLSMAQVMDEAGLWDAEVAA